MNSKISIESMQGLPKPFLASDFCLTAPLADGLLRRHIPTDQLYQQEVLPESTVVTHDPSGVN